ncbi:MAG TPA: SRPBCC family protein [Dermatophilaceae bacterium]|nr:SRPBCC family protein [Dermatophilaceae bacterium]
MRLEASTEIDAPAPRVWELVQDVERWPQVLETVTSVEPLSPGPLATGSRYRLVQPRLRPAVWSVTGYVPGRSFRWVAPNPGVATTGDHMVTPLGDTRSRLDISIEHRGPLAWLAGRLTRSLTEDYLAKECAGIKRAAEA